MRPTSDATCAARQVSTEPGHDLEVLLHRPDGTQVWALVSHSPVHDDAGERLGWVYRVKEHTQQRALMAELGRRNAQLAEAQRSRGSGASTETW